MSGVLLASMGLRPGDTPVVITPTAVLRHPTPGEFAALLGLTYHPISGPRLRPGRRRGGPAGLAASVYGASEGLDTCRSTPSGPAGRPAPAPGSRTMRGSPTAYPVTT